jgi:hypothetical protein
VIYDDDSPGWIISSGLYQDRTVHGESQNEYTHVSLDADGSYNLIDIRYLSAYHSGVCADSVFRSCSPSW